MMHLNNKDCLLFV